VIISFCRWRTGTNGNIRVKLQATEVVFIDAEKILNLVGLEHAKDFRQFTHWDVLTVHLEAQFGGSNPGSTMEIDVSGPFVETNGDTEGCIVTGKFPKTWYGTHTYERDDVVKRLTDFKLDFSGKQILPDVCERLV
jgi:hypothetical protein